jgi:hypothetical protein
LLVRLCVIGIARLQQPFHEERDTQSRMPSRISFPRCDLCVASIVHNAILGCSSSCKAGALTTHRQDQ